MNDFDTPTFFNEWLKRRRQRLDLTQAELAARVGCSIFALRKIETGERRPSKQLAGLLATALEIPPAEQATFVRAARGEIDCAHLPVEPPLRVTPSTARPSPAPAEMAAGLTASRAEAPAPALHNWPPCPTPLVGREDELASLDRLLADPLCRLLTLIGPGGIGKTRLAVEAATRSQARFADGVWFVPLAPVATPAAVIPALAEALELTLRGQLEPQRQLLSHLAGKQALLVVDNLEHLLAEVSRAACGELSRAVTGLLVDILAHAPAVKLIATSRERLNLQSEYVFVTQGLPVPPADQLHRGHDYDAIRLFAQAAQRAGAGVMLQGEELAAAAQVCRLVEGMPLGIELAAAWTPLLSCQEIAQEIQRSLDFLTTGLRDLPERQRSLRAVFDHSWRLLTGEERTVLARLSIFQGGFERKAAQEVAGAGLSILLALASKSLVRRTARLTSASSPKTESGRYDLHEVVRQYAFSHLSQTPEWVETCDRHSRFYLALLHQQDAALRGRAQSQARRSLTDEIDNLRAAWDWALSRGMFDAIVPAVRGFAWLFELSGWLDEGMARLEAAIQAGRAALDDSAGQRMLGEALGQRALLLFRRGDFAQALACTGESLELLRPLANPNLLTHPLLFHGIILFLQGEMDGAQAFLEEALVCARSAGDDWCEAYADFNLGYLTHLRGDHQAGYDRMVAVLTPWRAVGDPRSISLALNHLGPAAVQLGRYQEAEAFLQEGMRLCQEIGDRWGVGTALRYLGLAALAQGDAARAQALLRQSLDVHRGFVAGWDIARTLIYLGQAAQALGDADTARTHYAEALAVAEESSLPLLVEEARLALA